MANKKPNLKYNILFQKESEYVVNDTRFTKVKIWLMHLGINHNGSSFSKEVVEEAIPTLANTPILGYIENNSFGEEDFADHRYGIKYNDEDGKTVYKGTAFGVIPENNNAHFQKRLCDDGIEREFLVVNGLIWNKLSDGVDILNRDLWKSQSMELNEDEDSYDGEFDSNFVYHFKRFQFYGACMLGKDYLPAMEDARLELAFNNKIKNTLLEKVKIFNNYIENIKEETGLSIEELKKELEEKSTAYTQLEKNFQVLNAEKDELTKELEEKKALNTEMEKTISDLNETNTNLKTEIENKNGEYTKLQEEFQDYKAEIQKERDEIDLKEKENIIQEYTIDLSDVEEFKEISENQEELSKYTVKDLEKKMFTLYGRKMKEKAKAEKAEVENNGSRVYFSQTYEANSNSPYGDLINNVI